MPEELVPATPSCQDIAARSEATYGEKYCAELEKTSNGKFIAINVTNGDGTLADPGEDAVRLALETDHSGFFHLLRVGHKAAFQAMVHELWPVKDGSLVRKAPSKTSRTTVPKGPVRLARLATCG